MADRGGVCRWLGRGTGEITGRAISLRRDRPALHRTFERAAQANTGGSRSTHLEAGGRDLGGNQETLRGASSRNHDHRIPRPASGTACFPRRRGDSNLEGSSGSADLLPRRAVDALGAAKGGDQAPGPKRSAPARLAAAQHRRAPQPSATDGPSHLRQLPFFSPRRQDPGNGPGRPSQRQGVVRPGLHPKANVHPGRRCDLVGDLPRPERGAAADWVHVTSLAGRAVGGDHGQGPGRHAGRLLRSQLQGLPFPPGVLSHARHPRLVQPGHRSNARPAGSRRSALCTHGRGLESRWPIPCLCAGGSEGPLSRRPHLGRIRQ